MPQLYPDDPGPLKAFLIGAGQKSDAILDGLTQAYLAARGETRPLQALASSVAEKQRLYRPLQEARPIATGFGEALPSMAVPIAGSGLLGLAAGGAVAGGLPEALAYGSVQDRVERAAGAAAAGAAAGLLSPMVEAGARKVGGLLSGASKAPQLSASLPASDDLAYASRGKIGAPHQVPLRSFEHDYPSGEFAGQVGQRLLADVDGRPLGARHVAGRREVGGDDIPLSYSDLGEVADLLGIRRSGGSKADLGRDVGRMVRSVTPQGDVQRTILVSDSLASPKQAADVFAHEMGHAIDDMTFGRAIPADGLTRELEAVYKALNGPNGPNTKGRWVPTSMGLYSDKEAPAEMMAEAVRAYAVNPNWLKTVAPKTAARIRAAVNGNPNLNKAIQFNELAPVGLAGVLGAGLMSPDDPPR